MSPTTHLPNGLLLQWGRTAYTQRRKVVHFPISFASTPFAIATNKYQTVNGNWIPNNMLIASNITVSQFTFGTNDNTNINLICTYIAIGKA